MKRALKLGCCLPLAVAVMAAAPAAPIGPDALVRANLSARGGAQALAAIRSVRFEGRTIFPGNFELSYRETRARMPQGAATRVDAAIQGLTLVQAWDGREAWRINPFEGRKDAERMSADEARQLADGATIEGPLLSSRVDGSSVAYLGREDYDGTQAYKLRVTQKDGDEFVYLLDPDTYLEIKTVETRRIRGAPVVSETELGDYEKVGGVMFPMSVESWAQGSSEHQRTQIASAVANVDAPPALFAEPAGTPANARPAASSSTAGQTDRDQSAAGKPSEPAAASAKPPVAR